MIPYRKTLVTAFYCLPWLLLQNAPVSAHAILVKANPEKESSVTNRPDEILLTFNEGVGTEYLALAVSDSTGQRVDKHDAHLDLMDHSRLKASLNPLSPGHYTVRYRVLSADGHVVSGNTFFDIK